MSDAEPRALDGRVPGQRGLATRARLLTRAEELLEETAYRDLTVIDIARAAGTSPATFYQYFSDVEEAVLELAGQAVADGSHLVEIAETGPWSGNSGAATAAALVDGFLDLWDQHRSTMRVVELSTAEGDDRFRAVRAPFLNEVARALARHVEAARSSGAHPQELDPMAVASVVVSMLVHVSAHEQSFEDWGIDRADLRNAMTRQVFWSVAGAAGS